MLKRKGREIKVDQSLAVGIEDEGARNGLGSRGPAEGGAAGSLARGLKLIEALADAPAPMLLVELAERAHLDNSTVHRLVQLLCQEGYAVRLPSKRYCAGPKAIGLLATYHPVNSLCREVESVLHELRDRLGETIILVLFTGIERVIVKVVQGREGLSQSYETWLRTPLHGSASGKVMLMHMTPARLREVLGQPPYRAVTEFTVTDEALLQAELARARDKGYATARDDAFVGMTAISAPLLWSERAFGCLTIVGSSSRLPVENEDHLGGALRDCARLIEHAAPSVRSFGHCLGA